MVAKNFFGKYLLFLFRKNFLFLAFCDLCWPALTAAFSSKYFLGNPWTNFFLICQECSESWKKYPSWCLLMVSLKSFDLARKVNERRLTLWLHFSRLSLHLTKRSFGAVLIYSNVRFGTKWQRSVHFYSIRKYCFSLILMSFRFWASASKVKSW